MLAWLLVEKEPFCITGGINNWYNQYRNQEKIPQQETKTRNSQLFPF